MDYFGKILYFHRQNLVNQEECNSEYADKSDAAKGGQTRLGHW